MQNRTRKELTRTADDLMGEFSEDMIRPLYQAPRVFSYTDEDILAELGPAQTLNYGGGGTTGFGP